VNCTILLDGKSPPHEPCELAGEGRRSPRSRLGHRRSGESKNGVKACSGSHLIEPNLIPQTCLTDGSDMSNGLRLDNLS
jgi:hypothetical protein